MSFRLLLATGALMSAASGAALMSAAPAAGAQSPCGERYAVEYGDTLYQIAQQCRTPMSRIMALNPDLDPRSLEVGAVIQLERGETRRDPDPRASQGGGRYEVRQGDTPYSIAERLGLSLFELLAANTDIDPDALQVGEVIDVPGSDRRQSAVSISPQEGEADTPVTIEAYNLRPGDWVTIGAGVQASEWRRLREAQVDRDGRLTATVDTPDWADPGDDLIYVVDTDRGVTLKSDVFDVVGDRRGDDGRIYAFEGRVREGVECYTLQAENGNEYALTSRDVRFNAGEYVRVEGRRADASFCQQGRFTLDVGLIEEVEAPGRDDGRSERLAFEGRVRSGVECETLTTPNGDVWSLVSDDIAFTPGEYVEVEGYRADASVCQQGVGTLDVRSIDEVAPPRDETDRDETGRDDADDAVTMTGRIREGVECDTLTTRDGDLYSVVSDDVTFTPGEYVQIKGSVAEMSFCQQGEATIDVDSISEPRR